jgi:hypothetical protein
LEDYDFSVDKGGLDVDLSDLSDLRDQVLDLDIVVDLDHDMHGLIIVHIVVTLCELLEVLPITVRLATLHSLKVALVCRESRAFTVALRIRVDSLKALKSDISIFVLNDLIMEDVLDSVGHTVDDDGDCGLRRFRQRQGDV